jgi:hypothetical protein
MYYVEQFGLWDGPYSIEYAVKLCGWLNFAYPGTAIVRTQTGAYAQ